MLGGKKLKKTLYPDHDHHLYAQLTELLSSFFSTFQIRTDLTFTSGGIHIRGELTSKLAIKGYKSANIHMATVLVLTMLLLLLLMMLLLLLMMMISIIDDKNQACRWSFVTTIQPAWPYWSSLTNPVIPDSLQGLNHDEIISTPWWWTLRSWSCYCNRREQLLATRGGDQGSDGKAGGEVGARGRMDWWVIIKITITITITIIITITWYDIRNTHGWTGE